MAFGEHTGSAGKFLQDAFDGAGRFMCRLWNLYPDHVSGNKGVGGGNMIESFFQNLCPDNPPPPTSPFNGGQCLNVDYNFKVSYSPAPGQGPFIDTVGTGDVNFGPISEPKLILDTGISGQIEGTTHVEGQARNGFFILQVKCNGIPFSYRFGYTGFFETASADFLGVEREDGQPDNCGNPPAYYPPTTPPAPGVETYNVPIVPPDGPTYNIPLIWNDVDFNFPITFNVVNNPEIEIKFDFDGINIDFGPSPTSPDGTPKFVGPGSDPVYSPPDNPDLNDRLPPKPINPNDYDGTQGEPMEEEEKEDPEITFITIDVVTLPYKDKRILLPNPEDTVFFAGYFCWTVNERRTVESPIRKLHTAWVKPTWATGYAAYAVNGAVLKIDSFKAKST